MFIYISNLGVIYITIFVYLLNKLIYLFIKTLFFDINILSQTFN